MINDVMKTSKAQLTFYWPCGATTTTDSVSWELPAASQVGLQREDSYFFCNVARTLLRVQLLAIELAKPPIDSVRNTHMYVPQKGYPFR